MKKILIALVLLFSVSEIAFAISNSEIGSTAIHSTGKASYVISDTDTAGDPQYFGYVNSTGNWYIAQYNVSAGTFRYAQGSTGYADAWTARGSQSYDYFYTYTW